MDAHDTAIPFLRKENDVSNDITLQKPTAELEAEQTRLDSCYRPAVDILENEEELTLHADVPGASADGIDIQFEDGLLVLHAKAPPRNENVDFLIKEYGVGDYYRTFRVTEAVAPERITANLADGVLTVHLPKPAAAKPRKIPIYVGQ